MLDKWWLLGSPIHWPLFVHKKRPIGLVVGHVLCDFSTLPLLYGLYTSDIFYPSGYLRSLEITADVSGCSGGCCIMCQTYCTVPTNKTQSMDSPFFWSCSPY